MLWGYLTLAACACCLVPLLFLGTNPWAGIRALFVNRIQLVAFGKEIGIGMVMGVAASVIVSLAVSWLLDRQKARLAGGGETVWKEWRKAVAGCLAVPGFCGSLVVSLVLVNLFQRSPWHMFYGGIVPWLAGLVLWLIPRALMLEVILGALDPANSEHLARLIQNGPSRSLRQRGSQLIWELAGRRRLLGCAFLAFWAYLDLATAQILAPAGLASAPIRLYIQMHFGRNATLSAMTCLAVLVPVTLYLSMLLVRAVCVRWLRR